MTIDIVDCYSDDRTIGSTKTNEITPNFIKERALPVQIFYSATVRIGKEQFKELLLFKEYINHLENHLEKTHVDFFIDDGFCKLENTEFSYKFYTYGDTEISTKRYDAKVIIKILEYLFESDYIVYISNAKTNNQSVLAIYNLDDTFILTPTEAD